MVAACLHGGGGVRNLCRFSVEDVKGLDKEGFVAALQSLVPPKLPALVKDGHSTRVRQRLLMRGHTSYLTFCTLFRKDSPAIKALFEDTGAGPVEAPASTPAPTEVPPASAT